MSEICAMFACVYAVKDGCAIEGYMSNEGKLNGAKKYCNIYKVMCTNAKCRVCSHKGEECCSEEKEVSKNET